MSESPKMGLFGSKDNTKETKKESTKTDSPDRYAPYCIDSDSETYDTEALSIMDINDIIGVQSEPVGDSTLESEIAALSEIITESKSDDYVKSDVLRELSGESSKMCDTNDQLATALEELESVCSDREVTNISSTDESKVEKTQFSVKTNVREQLELRGQTSNTTSDIEDNCQSTASVDDTNRLVSSVNPAISEDANIDDIVSRSAERSGSEGDAKTEEKTVESVSAIGGSLQLIGEAYTSEDSQETNDVELRESSRTGNEKPVTCCNEGEESGRTSSQPQDNIGNDNLQGCVERKMSEELSDISEERKDIGSSQSTASLHQKENCNKDLEVDTTNTVAVGKENCKESNVDEIAVAVENVAIERLVDEVEKEVAEPFAAIRVSGTDKQSAVDENKGAEVIEGETKLEETETSRMDGVNTPDVEGTASSAAEAVDKLDTDSGTNEEENERAKGTDATLCREESAEDSVDNSNISKSILNILESLNEEDETATAKFESIEAVQQDSNVPVDSGRNLSSSAEGAPELSSETEIPQNSDATEAKLVSSQSLTELPVSETVVEDQYKTSTSMTPSTVSTNEALLDAEENGTSNLKSTSLGSQAEVALNISPPTDAIPSESSPEESTDPREMDAEVTQTVLEVCSREAEETTPVKLSEPQEEDPKMEEQEIVAETCNKEKEESSSSLTSVAGERPIENPVSLESEVFKSTADADVGDGAKEATSTAGNVDTVLENANADEVVDNSDEKGDLPDSRLVEKQAFLPPFDQTDITVPEEDAEEEHIEEEMTLTLDAEVSELQSETDAHSIEKDLQEDVGITEEADIEALETKNDDTQSSIVEKPSIININPEATCSDSNENSVLAKDPEDSANKPELDNSKDEPETSKLKNILETANVVDMFTGEPCQNTQDIVTSILDDVRSATDFKNILDTEAAVENEIEQVLQQSEDLPLVGSEIEELNEKLPQESDDILNKDMEDSMSAQNIDSLEGLLDLDLIPETEDSALKTAKAEEATLSKDVDVTLLLDESNRTSDIAEASDYITDVMSSCLTDTDSMSLQDNAEKSDIVETLNKCEESEASENIISESINDDTNSVDIQKHLGVDANLPENDLDMEFEENPLETVDDLEESDSKLELAPDMLLENMDQTETLNDAPPGIDTSQASSEISELESAVKFLQESEEQAIDSPLVLSPKMVESVVDDISKQADASSLFVADEDICEDTAELVAELQDIETDSISISEAEIISEAAKLENERKLAEQLKLSASSTAKHQPSVMESDVMNETVANSETDGKFAAHSLQNIEMQRASNIEKKSMSDAMTTLSQKVFKVSDSIPKTSILEERLKEPPKIEIPTTDITKVSMSPTTSKDSLLIQKDAKLIAYQRMLESPKLSDKSEPKIMDTPRKDSEKHDFENVGSPRIILKIAKSAIADCGEPRSPKSPKIRSAANSPNPEDSPGQKLGKIKLKLSKGGHPSIISNENIEEIGQWHSEGASSLSPLGMKIKFSKSGDASIVSSEKHESIDDSKEAKRTESPIGMKIKFSKTGDASIVQQEMQMKHKDKLDIIQGSPKRTESPIGMKIKLSKSGDASIIPPDRQDFSEEYKDGTLKSKETYGSPKRTESPIGMKIKFSKSGDASIVSPDTPEEGKEAGSKLKEKLESSPEIPKRTESPIGVKIKLSKTKGGASIISMENTEDPKDKLDIPDIPKRTESPLGMKIKLSKTGDASIVHSEVSEEAKDAKQKEKSGEASTAHQELDEYEVAQDATPKVESPLGMKIKLSKFGDASIIPTEKPEQVDEHKSRESVQDIPKRTESPIGMKFKLSKTGDASIIQSEFSEDANKTGRLADLEHHKTADASLGMKIKLLKTGDASIVDAEKKDRQRRRDTESSLEMKIKLSKTGHPTIVACEGHAEAAYKPKDADPSHNFAHRYKEPTAHKEPALKILKTGHSTILQSNRAELTIEPVQMQSKKAESPHEISPKRKEITISPIESKKSKLETQLSQILPEVTIQPVIARDQKQLIFEHKSSLISRQQMNVISQEISITQVRPSKTDTSMSEKLKDILSKNVSGSPISSDCEIIEHRPELIIVNENSNSSQDVVIIEEVSPNRMSDVKMPKKRGRPRRTTLPHPMTNPPPQLLMPRDPLALEEVQQPVQLEPKENERPKRTCRSQKSYAPPKRGRGRGGRGKRKMDGIDLHLSKKSRLDQDLSAIEASTMAVITLDEPSTQESLGTSSELYKALKQPPMDCKPKTEKKSAAEMVQRMAQKPGLDDKTGEQPKPEASMLIPPGHPNWLTPMSKRQLEGASKQENLSTVQVIDEETRMSAESGSRSQTPARNISVQASETIVNEESQGSVLSTATTESEKVKVKNRRMEINFDPDEGPFTVDKIAEYEWPLDRKGETFMIQEQISQYLGVKSFKRKYPDLKRRVVDMEERNYLRENGLVSESMCDMGLTAVCSSEVLDVMCGDFPDQYEEYRKHMREKQVKEHSKKQKELTAAANAEKNRIDLAEMAVQSALSWNVTLNKSRKENRKCSLDLQTFTIHVPKKQQKVESEHKISHYPVALIPGQYTDYYREYTAAELRYYPLNTVLYGPTRPNERKFDSQSEGSQSDSDSDSSSDDSSSSSSEGTQDTEGSQSTMDDVDMEIVNQKDEIKFKCKMCLKALNKHSKNEILIQCGTCNGNVHPSCIDLTLDMVPHIQSYAWQCTDCKTCAQCHDPADEDKMLFCDMCDRGYHIYCVGLRRVPQGRWHCQECAVCANCGSREPGGINSDRNSVALWQHEYKKGEKNTRVYVSTLCVPCSKLRGDQGNGI